jgi:hypothetical protein
MAAPGDHFEDTAMSAIDNNKLQDYGAVKIDPYVNFTDLKLLKVYGMCKTTSAPPFACF